LRRRRAFLFLAPGFLLDRLLPTHSRSFRLGKRIPVAETTDAADRRHALLVRVEAAIIPAVAIDRAPGGLLGSRGCDEREPA
jgi:hypothetical protein